MIKLEPRPLTLPDAFSFIRFVKETGLRQKIADVLASGEMTQVIRSATDADGNVNETSVGLGMFMLFGEELADAKVESGFYRFLAPILGATEADLKACELVDVIEAIFEAATIERWKSFFTSASAMLALPSLT